MTYGRDSPIPSALRGRAGSHSNLRTNCARGSALLRNFAQKRTAWSRPRERRDVPGRVYAAEKRSGPLKSTAVGGAAVEGVSAWKISPTSRHRSLHQATGRERYPRTGTVPKYHVVVDLQVDDLGGVDQLPGEPQILSRRGRVPRGVIVDQDERSSSFA